MFLLRMIMGYLTSENVKITLLNLFLSENFKQSVKIIL